MSPTSARSGSADHQTNAPTSRCRTANSPHQPSWTLSSQRAWRQWSPQRRALPLQRPGLRPQLPTLPPPLLRRLLSRRPPQAHHSGESRAFRSAAAAAAAAPGETFHRGRVVDGTHRRLGSSRRRTRDSLCGEGRLGDGKQAEEDVGRARCETHQPRADHQRAKALGHLLSHTRVGSGGRPRSASAATPTARAIEITSFERITASRSSTRRFAVRGRQARRAAGQWRERRGDRSTMLGRAADQISAPQIDDEPARTDAKPPLIRVGCVAEPGQELHSYRAAAAEHLGRVRR